MHAGVARKQLWVELVPFSLSVTTQYGQTHITNQLQCPQPFPGTISNQESLPQPDPSLEDLGHHLQSLSSCSGDAVDGSLGKEQNFPFQLNGWIGAIVSNAS